jgi:hypothetical protein
VIYASTDVPGDYGSWARYSRIEIVFVGLAGVVVLTTVILVKI